MYSNIVLYLHSNLISTTKLFHLQGYGVYDVGTPLWIFIIKKKK